MYEHAKTIRQQETASWKWNLVPLLIVTVALSGLLLPHGNADMEAAAEPASRETPSVTGLLVPSPEPGEGEPELRAEDLPQPY